MYITNMNSILEKFKKNPHSLTRQETMELQKMLGFTLGKQTPIAKRVDGIMGKHTIAAAQQYLNNPQKQKKENIFSQIIPKTGEKSEPSILENWWSVFSPKDSKAVFVPADPIKKGKTSKRPGMPTTEEYLKDVRAGASLRFADTHSLNQEQARLLLNPQINNAIRQELGMKPLQITENLTPDQLIDDKFVIALGQKVNPKHSLPVATLNNAMLQNMMNHKWENVDLNAPNSDLSENDKKALQYLAWKNGYGTFDGKAIDDAAMEQIFAQNNPQFKKDYDAYIAEKHDKEFQQYRKDKGITNILTPAEHNWQNIRLKHAVLPGQGADWTKYDEGARNGLSPWMGEHIYPLVDAVDNNTPATAYGAWGTVYPDRTIVGKEGQKGYFSNPNVNNVRIAAGEAAMGGRMRGNVLHVSRIQPVTDAAIGRIAYTSNELNHTWDPRIIYQKMLEENAKVGTGSMIDRANAIPNSTFIPDNWRDKAVATGGGNIPAQIKALQEAGFDPKTGRIAPWDPEKTGNKQKVFSAYDLSGGGNISLYYDSDGTLKSAYDEQDWEFKGQPLGPRGFGVMYQPSKTYSDKAITNADKLIQDFYTNRNKKHVEVEKSWPKVEKELKDTGILFTTDRYTNPKTSIVPAPGELLMNPTDEKTVAKTEKKTTIPLTVIPQTSPANSEKPVMSTAPVVIADATKKTPVTTVPTAPIKKEENFSNKLGKFWDNITFWS